MTKNEVIENAYGDHFEEMKPFIDENGWFDKNSFYNNKFSFNYEQLDKSFSHKDDFMRPPELNNIENNNGWIKIESEADLPKTPYGYYHICTKKPIYENSSNIGIDEFWQNDLNKKQWWLDNVHHYQPIQKPNPPLYQPLPKRV